MIEKKEKILAISSLRVIAMFLIVFYHCYAYYFHPIWHSRYPDGLIVDEYKGIIWLNYLHLPIFVFISGFLYGYQSFYYGTNEKFHIFLIKKIKRLIIPYMFWGIILMLIGQGTHSQFFFGQIAHLWFLPMLFIIFFIVGSLKNIIINLSPAWIFSFFPLTILLNLLIPIVNIECIFTSAVSYLTYFYAGLCVVLLYKKFNPQRAYLLFVISALSFVSSFFIRLHPFSIIICLRVLSVVILAASSLFLLKKQKRSRIIEKLDQHSMGIYIIHHIFIWGILDITTIRLLANKHYVLAPILLFITSIIISYTISYQISKSKYKHLILG